MVDGGDGNLLDGYLDKETAEADAEEMTDVYPMMHVKETSIPVIELLALIRKEMGE